MTVTMSVPQESNRTNEVFGKHLRRTTCGHSEQHAGTSNTQTAASYLTEAESTRDTLHFGPSGAIPEARLSVWMPVKGQDRLISCPLCLTKEKLPSSPCEAVCRRQCWGRGRNPAWSLTGTWRHSHLRCLGPLCTAEKYRNRNWLSYLTPDRSSHYFNTCSVFSTPFPHFLYNRNQFVLLNHNSILFTVTLLHCGESLFR